MTQSEALEILKMGHNVFLTGPAGSGKTHTLRAFIAHLKENGVPVAVTASTGIAATHLEGQTIHSWSGLGIKDTLTDYDIDILESRKYLWDRYQNTKVLIIDEISMLHHFRFDLLDQLARAFKRNDKAFGGMQVILCGDFFQLPPVSRPGEPEAHFAYRSKIWQEMDLKICYLTEQHRQNDDIFLQVLNDIRDNNVSEETLLHLKSRYQKEPISTVPSTKLSTHNENVDEINNIELGKITGEEKVFEMTSRGKANIVETLKKSCLAPEKLVIRVGARVMFVKNSFDKKYANGTLGIVEGFSYGGLPLVKTASGRVVEALPVSWIIEEDGRIKAEITQVPLRLAWAITVHKSQGMSLDVAEIDLSRSFAYGMGYVALSRVRSLSGLKLLGFNANALQIHPDVLEIDRSFRQMSRDALVMLEEVGKEAISNTQKEFLEKNGGKIKTKEQKEKELPTHHKTKLLIMEKLPLEKIAKARNLTQETIIKHIEDLILEKEELDLEYLRKNAFKDADFKKIEKAFKESLKKNGDYRLSPVKTALGSDFSYLNIRLARLFITKN